MRTAARHGLGIRIDLLTIKHPEAKKTIESR